nr:hypothetical protein [Tanacetum cinerariifolium]
MNLISKLEEKCIEKEQVATAQNQKLSVCYDDDDDEEESNSLKDNNISELPLCSAVTPSEPIDSLSMGDEHLDIIPAMESDEFIKSCVENLVPNPSESDGENGCDVPSCFTTFSNILFDDEYDEDFSSSDNEGPHETVQCQPMNYYETNPCYNYSGFGNFQPSQLVIDHLNLQQRINDSMMELRGKFQAWLQQRKYQVCQKIPLCYNDDDDDDEESSIPLRDIIIFELPLCILITPVVSTKDSLIMGDEHLDTIPEKESDEFIKSSVENLVPNP